MLRVSQGKAALRGLPADGAGAGSPARICPVIPEILVSGPSALKERPGGYLPR